MTKEVEDLRRTAKAISDSRQTISNDDMDSLLKERKERKEKKPWRLPDNWFLYALVFILTCAVILLGNRLHEQEKFTAQIKSDLDKAYVTLTPKSMTGLAPTADGMIMDNGAINYEALKNTLISDLSFIQIQAQNSNITEADVKRIARDIVAYYKINEDKIAKKRGWKNYIYWKEINNY